MERAHLSTLDVSPDEAEVILEHWAWLFRGMKLVDMNSFGDLFLEDSTGMIWLLDAGLGELHEAAPDLARFRELAGTEKMAKRWFMPDLIESARARGIVPGEGECLAFKKSLALGGALNVDNLHVMNRVAYHLVSSRLNDERRSHPLGVMLEGFE